MYLCMCVCVCNGAAVPSSVWPSSEPSIHLAINRPRRRPVKTKFKSIRIKIQSLMIALLGNAGGINNNRLIITWREQIRRWDRRREIEGATASTYTYLIPNCTAIDTGVLSLFAIASATWTLVDNPIDAARSV